MKIILKEACLDELAILNELYRKMCQFFEYIDPNPQAITPEQCLTQGNLPPNGILENYKIISIYLGDQMIGYCDYYEGFPDNETAYISLVFIDELYRNKGYATQLVDILCRQFKQRGHIKVRLGVSLKNWYGLKFWVKNGFSTITYVGIKTPYSHDNHGKLELERLL